MTDREARDVLAECVRLWLEGEVNLQELCQVSGFYHGSKDSVVAGFIEQVELDFLDEVLVHAKDLDKSQWDEVQRYLLLLDSDREFRVTKQIIWTRWQLVAIAGVLAFAAGCLVLGPLAALTWLSVPSGVLSWYITRKKTQKLNLNPWLDVLYPFDSFASLNQTLEEVNEKYGFEKMRWVGQRPQSRRANFTWLELLLFYGLLPTVFFLPFQAMPILYWKQEVVESEFSLA